MNQHQLQWAAHESNYHIPQFGEAPDYIGARRIKHAYNFYSIQV